MVDVAAQPTQIYLRINGQDVPEEMMHDLHEAVIETSLHLPAVATLTLNDSNLRWIDDPQVMPGQPLEVLVKVERQERVIFDGEIVELEPEFGASTHRLVVRAFDRLHRLGRGRHVRSFQQVTDSDLVERIAAEVGLRAEVEATRVVHDYVLQHNQSNLEFLRERMSALGYLLFVRGKTLHCQPAGQSGAPLEAQWGVELSEFRPRMTTIGQVENVVVRGWDPENRQAIVGEATNGAGKPDIGERRAGGELSSAAFNLPAHGLVTHRTVRQQAAADAMAAAMASRIAGRFVEAEGACAGNPDLNGGVTLDVSGVGDRFSGRYLVTSATHTYGLHGYRTQFTVSGQEPATLLSTLENAINPDRFGMSFGLAVALVTDNHDPDGQGRVKLMFPWLAEDEASFWARVAAPGAGAERGMQFLPEINDEVLVGFEHGNMLYPYVLGGLWNRQDPPPLPRHEAIEGGTVRKRVIRSRQGHTITLDDTAGGGGIIIEDSDGNRVGIDTARGSMLIDVGGDVDIRARGNLTLEAQGQLTVRGMGITIDGNPGSVSVKGLTIDLN